MTRYEKFSEFVKEFVIIPLIINFIVHVSAFVVCLVLDIEATWLLYTDAVVSGITVVWCILWLVCFIADKVIERRYEVEDDVEWNDDDDIDFDMDDNNLHLDEIPEMLGYLLDFNPTDDVPPSVMKHIQAAYDEAVKALENGE